MKIHANVQVKNEALLLEDVLPEWMEYPINKFVFLDDSSTDQTIDVIHEMCDPGRYEILHSETNTFNESSNRSKLLETSRDQNADIVISIDADELLSEPFLDDFYPIIEEAAQGMCHTFQWNVVGDMKHYRQDPAYVDNYRDFIFPMKYTGKFDLTKTQYHSPRTPPITNNIPAYRLPREYGFVHLQALDIKFYALKQLWYKHYEYYTYNKSVDEINAAYDPVVNGLNFNVHDIPDSVIYWDTIDPTVFDKMAKERDYVGQIKQFGMVDGLITFGKEYLI